ncbi:hypothetical protein L210DRAFT_2735887 [Boletus edulis BED1]|uniref:Uncharacterized protein n=1 Tax=Boletus edulis BED1 TaxID=1328754 RepID=A0AAD4GAL2_BOLED|nr:hypothetical protein L210DRAFT_2735887 [Boletus edulis BED1]
MGDIGVFMKRSKAYIAKGLWEDAIDDTNQVIMIDPSFPWGYERALVEWAKANLTDGAWRNALKTACSVLCERLEALDCITDAIECFHDMARNSAKETNGEQMKWIIGES